MYKKSENNGPGENNHRKSPHGEKLPGDIKNRGMDQNGRFLDEVLNFYFPFLKKSCFWDMTAIHKKRRKLPSGSLRLFPY